MTSFFTGEYSYSEQCVRDTNWPNRLGILSTQVSKFVTILFYTHVPYIRSQYAGYEFEGIKIWGWFTEDGEWMRISRDRSYSSVPFLWRSSSLCFNIPYLPLRILLRAALLLCSKYTSALPWQHFQSSSRHLCLSKCIAVESCKPILVLRLEIYSISYARPQTWNFDRSW